MNRAYSLFPLLLAASTFAQDRLPLMPGYDNYVKMRGVISKVAMSPMSLQGWGEDGSFLQYTDLNGAKKEFDWKTKEIADATRTISQPARTGRQGRQGGRERGRQFASADSPDGAWKLSTKDRNVWLDSGDGKTSKQLTTEGSVANRIKYGVASWVYGEELAQTTAMWWSPDSNFVGFYRFDESQVPDYFLALQQTALHTKLDTEAYPKPGDPNPKARIDIYNVKTGQTVPIKTDFDTGFDPDISHYIYAPEWTPDGSELLIFRKNRKQNKVELIAANPATGECRSVIREENPTGWVENTISTGGRRGSSFEWIGTGKGSDQEFLWISERDGFRNIYRYNVGGKLLAQVSHLKADVQRIYSIDAKRGEVWYSAHDGDRPTLIQLHRAKLNGSGDTLLTSPSLSHNTVMVSPTFDGFADIAEDYKTPQVAEVCDRDGKVLADLGKKSMKEFREAGLRTAERFTLPASDGKEIAGWLQFPSGFDPSKRYPMLVDQYGGPDSGTDSERFMMPPSETELGFLVLHVDGRGSAARGRAYRQANYLKLGTYEIDDTAAAVKFLGKRPYVNADAVGVDGVSYGGYFALMSILRYPDVYRAASCGSPVTSWEQYDTIYTERFMDTPANNPDGYKNGSALTFVQNLKGAILLYFGTADNNVHPNNMMQLVQKLNAAGKSYEMGVGPDFGHSGINRNRQLEFFIDNLILKTGPLRKSGEG